MVPVIRSRARCTVVSNSVDNSPNARSTMSVSREACAPLVSLAPTTANTLGSVSAKRWSVTTPSLTSTVGSGLNGIACVMVLRFAS